MRSLKKLYRIGRGPSSSHTIGPQRAANIFKSEYPEADGFRITLYGSLAKTGQGTHDRRGSAPKLFSRSVRNCV